MAARQTSPIPAGHLGCVSRIVLIRPKILILTSGPLCRNPRPLKEAWTLGESGYEVTVITVARDPNLEAMDRELLQRAPFRKSVVDLVGHAGRGWTRSFVQRTKTRIARSGVRIGIQSAEAVGPHGALLRLARAHPADLTIAHTEVGLCVARDLATEGRRVAVDFEDWHSEDLLASDRAARPLRLLRQVELELLRHAVFCTTTSASMAAALQSVSNGPPPVVITNSFPLQPCPANRIPAQTPSLLWFSQTIGPGRGLEQFIDAWSSSHTKSRLCLLGNVDQAYRAHLVQRAASHRRDAIEYLPIVPPWELPAVIARHDVGLALEAVSPRSRDLTITNKMLQYLNAGLPIIATRTAGQSEVLSRAPDAGVGIDLEETAAVAAQLDSLLTNRERLSSMARAARVAAETIYCWEREAPRLQAAVDAALHRATPAMTL